LKASGTNTRARPRHSGASSPDDDVDVVEGRRDELAGKIQARYGKTRDEAEREIDDWLNNK
jgi:uncharacterized protein YjbJ (UPF0337 family)